MTESSAQIPTFSFGDRLFADPSTRDRRALVTRVMQASLAAVEPGEAVRRALSEGSLRAMTVTEVATSHGFYELGRFSVSYRSMYGEAPSETLRACRR